MKQQSANENQIFDLTQLAQQWFSELFDAFVDNRPGMLNHITFDVRDFISRIIMNVYEYQRKQQLKTSPIKSVQYRTNRFPKAQSTLVDLHSRIIL